jgi:hypothetical protein
MVLKMAFLALSEHNTVETIGLYGLITYTIIKLVEKILHRVPERAKIRGYKKHIKFLIAFMA